MPCQQGASERGCSLIARVSRLQQSRAELARDGAQVQGAAPREPGEALQMRMAEKAQAQARLVSVSVVSRRSCSCRWPSIAAQEALQEAPLQEAPLQETPLQETEAELEAWCRSGLTGPP